MHHLGSKLAIVFSLKDYTVKGLTIISILRFRSIGKSRFRNLLSKARTDFTSEKSVLRVDSNREIQIRMSWISFLPFHWEIRKRICKTILVNMGLLFANNPKSGFSNLNDDFPMERTLNLTFLKKFLL